MMTTTATFRQVTTRAVPPEARFDFWRQQFGFVSLERPDRAGSPGFDAAFAGCVTGDGIACGRVRTDPTDGTYGRRETGMLIFAGALAGRGRIIDGSGDRTIGPESGLALMDCDRRARFLTDEGYEFLYLAVPRAIVADAVGRRDLVPAGALAMPLPATAAGSLLWANMQAFLRHGEGLTAGQCAAATAGMTDLLIATLKQVVSGDAGTSGGDGRLYAAAQAFIGRHYGRSTLTAGDVAAALGCSRAHLYRVFGRFGRSIAGDLRQMRLQRAAVLMMRNPAETIGQIAFDCGYTDLAAFGKAFRRRFGVSPGAWRRANAAADAETPGDIA